MSLITYHLRDDTSTYHHFSQPTEIHFKKSFNTGKIVLFLKK